MLARRRENVQENIKANLNYTVFISALAALAKTFELNVFTDSLAREARPAIVISSSRIYIPS